MNIEQTKIDLAVAERLGDADQAAKLRDAIETQELINSGVTLTVEEPVIEEDNHG